MCGLSNLMAFISIIGRRSIVIFTNQPFLDRGPVFGTSAKSADPFQTPD